MRTLTVTGHGSFRAVPDSAEVRISLAVRAPSVAEAVAGCDAAFSVALDVATRHTDPARVATRNVHVVQAWSDGAPHGFEAEHALAVTCPDLASAGRLVTDLAAEVGDRLRVETVQLTVGDTAAPRALARLEAYDDAVARARALAAHAGATLGGVQSISEGGAGGPQPMAAQLSLAPGETELVEQLVVTFELL